MEKNPTPRAEDETVISRHLARRMRPLALAIGLFISFGIPSVYGVVAYKDRKLRATYYARELADKIHEIALGNPLLWKYQVQKYFIILDDFLINKKELSVIHILDGEGKPIAGFEHSTSEREPSLHLIAYNEPEPILFNNRYIGSTQVGICLFSIFINTLLLFLVSGSVGLTLGAVIYHFPVKVALGLELRLRELMNKLRRSHEELEVRVRERTEELVDANRALSREIAERERTETALRESEKRYRRIFEGAVPGIFQISVEGEILGANPAFASMFGHDSAESMLKEVDHASELHAAPSSFYELVRLAVDSGKPVRLERVFRRREGDTFFADLRAWVVYDGDGRLSHLEGFIEDITERKLAEEKKSMLESQLRQAVKMEAVGTLAGGVAHDFNNLLQAIMGYAEILLMRKEETDSGYRESMEIMRAARRGGELTKQLLTFSRKAESDLRRVDLNSEIRQVAGILERTVPKMISIELRLQDDLPHVYADRVQIERILMNLAINARDAMPDGGRLTVETERFMADDGYCEAHPELEPGEYVVLTVSDTGCGMDEETMKNIFDPFFTTKAYGKGTGLGLSIIYGIVKSHGGHVSCRSEPGKGTAFKIHLPGIEPIEEPFRETAEESTPAGGTETILLVDDESRILDLGAQILTDFGYSVVTATDGESALEIYRKERGEIDLVVLDLIMPGMGGRKLLRELYRMDPGAKVVIASGYPENAPADEACGERSECLLISKPYETRQLLTAIRRVLDA
jgi:PAS domain S-box-containing protein